MGVEQKKISDECATLLNKIYKCGAKGFRFGSSNNWEGGVETEHQLKVLEGDGLISVSRFRDSPTVVAKVTLSGAKLAEYPIGGDAQGNNMITNNINIHGGQVNLATGSYSNQIQNITLKQLDEAISNSDTSAADKQAARSKLSEFLTHPVVAAIVGGLAGKTGGGG